MSKKLILSVLAFIFASGGTFGGYKVYQYNQNYGADFDSVPHTVLRVIDGDTFTIASAKEGEKEIRVRMLGLDSPEKGTCYFTEAKENLESLIEGEGVWLEKDNTGIDRYGRLLRYVIVKPSDPEASNTIINETILRNGSAVTMSSSRDKKYRDLFATAQKNAKENTRGMWSDECDYLEENVNDLRESASLPENPECTIKGNISEKGYGKLYFVEGCPNYNRVKIDTKKGESWFCSEEEAETAGFSKSQSCNNTF